MVAQSMPHIGFAIDSYIMCKDAGLEDVEHFEYTSPDQSTTLVQTKNLQWCSGVLWTQ